ncbi:MAG: VIT domain-containing protein [Myxococcota bacterium]
MSERRCERFDEVVFAYLEGEGELPAEILEQVSTCSDCRDAGFEADALREALTAAGDDYRHPEDFDEQVLARYDRKVEGDVTPVAGDDLDRPRRSAAGVAATPNPDDDAVGTSGAAEAGAGPSPTGEVLPADERGARGDLRRPDAAPSRRPRLVLAAGVAALAAAAAAGIAFFGADEAGEPDAVATVEAPWTGVVAGVRRAGKGEGAPVGLEVCEADACRPAPAGTKLPAGSRLVTDARTRARVALDDGTTLVLDRATTLALAADENRRASLTSGALVAEVPAGPAGADGFSSGSGVTVSDGPAAIGRAAIGRASIGLASIELGSGAVSAQGAKLALRRQAGQTTIDVVRGVATVKDARGRERSVFAGQEGRLSDDEEMMSVASAHRLADAVAWSEGTDLGDEAGEPAAVARGLGELRASVPGSKEERQGAVRLTSHRVKVRVVDGFARTEVTETFENQTDDVLEGIYRFPLPPGAQIERLALEVDGRMEEGAFVDRERAAKIWRGAIVNGARRPVTPREEIIWVPGPWKDPALLEWQRGGRFELRIYPIPRRGSRKVVLTYTEAVPATGDQRRYTYPLPHDASGDLTVDTFAIDVQVRGHAPAAGVRVLGGYPAERHQVGPGVDGLRLEAEGFVPAGDLVVAYASAARHHELQAWTYRPSSRPTADGDDDGDPKPPATGRGAASADGDGDDIARLARAEVESDRPYVALSLRPELPAERDERQRAYALVVDASRSMVGERHRRAARLVGRLVAEMDRLDRFVVLSCDTTCRRMDDGGGGWRSPGHVAGSEVVAFLDGVTPDGASDPAGVVREATALGDLDGRRLEVVYVGDGTPTAGPGRPAVVRAALAGAVGPDARVTTVAIGADADAETLTALASAGGGVALPYVPGQRPHEVAYAVLGATLVPSLRDVEVDWPSGVEQVAPARPPTIMAGGELLVTARMTRPSLSGEVVVRGRWGDAPFERRYPLDVTAERDEGNAFVPRLFAAARIRDLEREGTAAAKAQAVAWSGAYNVASRYTSLLVLESPAMFKAFGLDNRRRVATWTGERTDHLADRSGMVASGEGQNVHDQMSGGSYGGKGRSAPARAKRRAEVNKVDGFGQRDADDEAAEGFLPPPSAPPLREPAPAPRPNSATPPGDPVARLEDEAPPPMRARRRPMIPMRRIYVRQAQVFPERRQATEVDDKAIRAARRAVEDAPNRRAAVRDLYALYARTGRVDDAEMTAERWAEREALDPEALTARAEAAAARGDRATAIRRLGSVIDVRPGDVNAQRRLARLHTWAGRTTDACRHWVTVAELRSEDVDALVEAVRCARRIGQSAVAEVLLRGAEDATRRAATEALASGATAAVDDPNAVRGDIQVTATWEGGADLDLALVHPDGHRVSWLGAPTRAIISAADVTSGSRESLGLLGSPAGAYAIEVVRADGGEGREASATSAPVVGELVVRAVGTVRRIPFRLVGARAVLGTIQVSFRSQLVPVRGWPGR